MEIYKNPIIIGLTAGLITYSYLMYNMDEKKNKKGKDKKKSKETVNLLIPLVVTIIVWFITYSYIEYNMSSKNDTQIFPEMIQHNLIPKKLPLPLTISPKYGFVKDVLSESTDVHSFSLLHTGINVPTKIPNVLIDIQ